MPPAFATTAKTQRRGSRQCWRWCLPAYGSRSCRVCWRCWWWSPLGEVNLPDQHPANQPEHEQDHCRQSAAGRQKQRPGESERASEAKRIRRLTHAYPCTMVFDRLPTATDRWADNAAKFVSRGTEGVPKRFRLCATVAAPTGHGRFRRRGGVPSDDDFQGIGLSLVLIASIFDCSVARAYDPIDCMHDIAALQHNIIVGSATRLCAASWSPSL